MGKRSDYPRVEKDKYFTPPKAIIPLLPHLKPGVRYKEPCAGAGDLITHLRPYATLVAANDIAPDVDWIEQGDAFNVEIGDAEQFITNPPWTRALLHALIIHLSDQAPTWLLFDSNWANTLQAKPFMERCRKIVAVGRLQWIPGSQWTGKDDASWYLFDKPIAGSAPLFFGRMCLPPEAVKKTRRICTDCGVLIDRFGKWKLKTRNGLATPVHVDCAFPSTGAPVAPASTPLFDWADGGVVSP